MDGYFMMCSKPWLLLRLLWDPLQAELVGSMIPGAGQQSSKKRREKREGAGLGIVDVEMARWPLAASRLVDCLTEPSLLADSSVPSAPLRESSMRLWEPVLPVCFAQDLMWVRRRWLRATAYRAGSSEAAVANAGCVYRVSRFSTSIRSTRTSSDGNVRLDPFLCPAWSSQAFGHP